MTDEERLKIIEEINKHEDDIDYLIKCFNECEDFDLLYLIIKNLNNEMLLEITSVKDMKVIKMLNDNNVLYSINSTDIMFNIEVLCYNLYKNNMKYINNSFNNHKNRLEFNNTEEVLLLIEKYNVDANIILSYIVIKYDISLETFLRFDDVCRLEYRFQDKHNCRYPLICCKDKEVVKAMLERGYRFQTNPFVSRNQFYDHVGYDVLKLYIENYQMKSFINPLIIYSFADGKLEELIRIVDEKYGKELMRKHIDYKDEKFSLVRLCFDNSFNINHEDEKIEKVNEILKQLKENIVILRDNDFKLTEEEKDLFNKYSKNIDNEELDEKAREMYKCLKEMFKYIFDVFDTTKNDDVYNDLIYIVFRKNLTLRQCRKLIKKYGDINIISDGVKAIDFHYQNHKIVSKILHHSHTKHNLDEKLILNMNNRCFKKYIRRNLFNITKACKYVNEDLEKFKIFIKRNGLFIEDFPNLSNEIIDYIIENVGENNECHQVLLERYLENEDRFFQIIEKKKVNLFDIGVEDDGKFYDNLRDYFLSKECHVNVRKYLEELKE